MAPLANDSIILGTLIQSFRHLKHQNLSTGDDFIDGSGIIFLVPFFATKEALALLTTNPVNAGRSIWLFRHLECQNPSTISDSLDRARMVQQFWRKGTEEQRNGTEYSWLRGCDRDRQNGMGGISGMILEGWMGSIFRKG